MNKRIRLFWILVLGSLLSCAHTGTTVKGTDTAGDPPPFLHRIYGDYLNHLSAVRAGVCPMYPSCSEYSKQCFKKHGFLIGWMMTCDRLMRCGRDEMKLSPRVFVGGQWKYYDPVERNTFWWSKKGS